jgi:hypothetical protein
MCLIAYRSDPNTHIPDSVIEYNLRSNPDGFGITWRNRHGLKTRKFAPNEAREFAGLLRQIDRSTSEYVAHWRFATHGEKSREMAHPFAYTDASGKEVIAFHNGIIDIKTEGRESDTVAFVNRILSRLPFGWWNDTFMRDMIEDAIGWSRMLFWTPKGVVRINEAGWTNVDGILYSTNPEPGTYTSTSYGTWSKYSKSDDWNDDDAEYTSAFGEVVKKDELLLPAKVEHPLPESAHQMGEMVQVDDYDIVFDVHEGHTVNTVDRWEPVDPNEPISATGSIDCLTCKAQGDYYVVDGQMYFEIDHNRSVTAITYRKGVAVPARGGYYS